MSTQKWITWIPILESICTEASKEILEVYADAEGVEIDRKADNSPLTQADQRANAVIVQGLNTNFPDIPIVSEENKLLDYDVRKHYETHWFVDPLDGTKEFIRRNGEFTVNIALIHKGSPVIGVVQVPVTGAFFWGVKNGGAFMKQDETIHKLRASPFHLSDSGVRVVASRSHLNEETQALLDRLNAPIIVSTGSSLKFLKIAKGETDFYPRVAPTMEWDTGAAQMVLEEAGGKVLQYDSGEPLRYGKENLLNPYFVAFGATDDIQWK